MLDNSKLRAHAMRQTALSPIVTKWSVGGAGKSSSISSASVELTDGCDELPLRPRASDGQSAAAYGGAGIRVVVKNLK
jgi:hypothetical protein